MLEEEKAKQTLAGILKETGLKDQIKKHLRVRLAERLQGEAEGMHQHGKDGLRHRMIVSALKEHMDKIGCVYSSSVFCAESGYEEKMLARLELQELLNLPAVDETHSIVQHLFAKISRDNPFLKHTEVQTTEVSPSISLQQKFAVIDMEFRRVLQQRNQITSPSAHGHNCNEEKAWYEKQLARFRQFQAHKIRIKVGEEWRIKFQAYAAEMEATYCRKLDKIRQKEKMLVEDFARKEKNLNEKIQGWQASARSRMELVQMKQATASREKANLQLQRKKAAEEFRRSVEQSKDKAREYENLILSMQKRIAYEVGLAKLNFQQQQTQKEEQQQAKRRFVEEEYDKLMRIKDTMGFVSKENQRLAKENDALRLENQELRKEVRQVHSQLRGKEDRLSSIKEELHTASLQKQELQKSLQNEGKMRKKREEELSLARKELEKLRARQLDQSEESIDIAPPRPTNPTSLKIDRLREERKKQIQRFKLEL